MKLWYGAIALGVVLGIARLVIVVRRYLDEESMRVAEPTSRFDKPKDKF